MSSALQTLLDAVGSTGAGSSFNLSALPRYQGGAHSFVVSGSFVGTVAIQGSIDGASSWVTLQTLTAGGIYSDTGVYTHIRGNVTAYTSGSITLNLRYGLLEDLKSDIDTLLTDVLAALTSLGTLLTRLSSARATLLDNLTRLDTSISGVSAVAQLENLVKQLRKEGRNL